MISARLRVTCTLTYINFEVLFVHVVGLGFTESVDCEESSDLFERRFSRNQVFCNESIRERFSQSP